MYDQDKSKEQLITELSELRKQLIALKAVQTPCLPAIKDSSGQEVEFKKLVENSPDGILRINQAMEILFANSLAIEKTGIPATTYIGKTPAQLNLQGYSFVVWKKHIEKVFATKQPSMFAAAFTNYKNQHFHYHARLVPEFDKDGSVQSVLCTLRNLNQLKKALSALGASEQRNKILLAAIPDLLIYLSNEGVYLDFHVPAPSCLYADLENCIGKSISEVMPSEPAAKLMTAIQHAVIGKQIQTVQYQQTINNILHFFEARIIRYNADSVLCIVRNISELTRLQQEFSRFEQLHLVGEIAASIGHEVRNPLTTVRGYLQWFALKPEFTSYKDTFSAMIEELDRANEIISEFLSLAKNKAVKLEQQNLNNIINAIAPLIQSTATISNKDLILDLQLIPDLLLDVQEIRQLILNIVNNGLEAMLPDKVITIKTFMENNKVMMTIQDMGTGIPPEHMDKLGTPFFTTKEQGTGLGLAVCYSIAARHNAAIDVATSPQGTTFIISFAL